jgi:hypothetical protein
VPPTFPTAFGECSHTLARMLVAGESVAGESVAGEGGGASGDLDTGEGGTAEVYGEAAARLRDVYPRGDPFLLAELTGLDEEAQLV